MAICEVCFHHCDIPERRRGFCGARTCVDGRVIPENYGKITALALDPIEKKPLARFHPGSYILSVGSFGCNLRCPFCQNYEISGTGMQALREDHGRNVTREHLVTLFLELQEQGAANINLVTATQFLPHIVWAIPKAREAGLTIPIVYNTSGYETAAQLRQLTGLVDCYLPDFKYMNGDIARQYSKAADYPQQVKEALAEMVGQTGPAVFDEKGMLQKGVIVRHLVLPGQKEQAKEIIRYLHETYGDQIWLSILNQYTPMPAVQGDPVLKRKLTTYEYEQVIAYALELGVEQAYRQEGNAAAESFIPSFHGEGVE